MLYIACWMLRMFSVDLAVIWGCSAAVKAKVGIWIVNVARTV